MRRATVVLALTLLIAGMFAVRGDAQNRVVNSINGIGLIDYSNRGGAKLGSWCRYHMTGGNAAGARDDYFMTVAIAGEERFWGEDCFWVETVTEEKGGQSAAVIQLMSYDIFSDSLPVARMKYYMRKSSSTVDEAGHPIQSLNRRPPTTLRVREKGTPGEDMKVDTLAVPDTTIQTLKGAFRCRQVRITEGIGSTTDQRDSTMYTEVRETRESYLSRQVPVTRIVMEDVTHLIKRRTWFIGRSKDAPMNTMDRSVGRAILVDYGTDYKAQIVPEAQRRSMAEQDRIAAASARPATRTTPRAPTRK